jgi:hypothetical protein
MHRISIRRPRRLLSTVFGLRKLSPPTHAAYLSATVTPKDAQQLQSSHRPHYQNPVLYETNCRSKRRGQYCFNFNLPPLLLRILCPLSIEAAQIYFLGLAIEQL